jgi:hypothetical protein
MSDPLHVTARPEGVTDTLYTDGLRTREAEGVVIVIRGVGAVQVGTVRGYQAQWIYERLTTEEIEDILELEYADELHARIASGLTLFEAGIDLLISIGINLDEVVGREPVRSWPPSEFLETEE